MEGQIGFVLVVEAGDLERKATLLVDSIRHFGGIHRDAPIWAVQPRAGRAISQRTLDVFTEKKVFYNFANINNDRWVDYPIANKVYACALVESLTVRQLQVLCFLDSDMVCVQSPVLLDLREHIDIAIKPVDYRNIGLQADQPITKYWDVILDNCGANRHNRWTVKTTVDQEEIRPYFNSGMIAVRPAQGIFDRWLKNLVRIGKNEAITELCIGDWQYRRYLDQVTLAATILAAVPQQRVQLMDRIYNYPLHLHRLLSPRTRVSRLEDVVFAHYHGAFYDLRWLSDIEMGNDLKHWFAERLPLYGAVQGAGGPGRPARGEDARATGP